jgi:plastocyanin
MKFLVSSLVAASAASAATIQIKVGPTLTFDPDNVKAAVGDTLEFHYYAQSHSVATSDFATPCKLNNRFYSGYYPATGSDANVSIPAGPPHRFP